MILVSNIMIALHYCDSTMPLSTSSQEVSKTPFGEIAFRDIYTTNRSRDLYQFYFTTSLIQFARKFKNFCLF